MDISTQARIALPSDAETLGRLLDQYRQFHGEPADLARAHRFMEERLERVDGIILIATSLGLEDGYLQMYPAHSSLKTEGIYFLSDFYAPRNFLWKDLADALLLEALNALARAGVYRLEVRDWGVDPWLQEFFEGAGFRWDASQSCYALNLPRQSPIVPSHWVDLEPEKLMEGNGVRDIHLPFFRQHRGLLEGWAVRRRMDRIEYVHGMESWTFSWRHPVCGRVEIDVQPKTLQSASGWGRWTYPNPDQNRLYRKFFGFEAVDFRRPDVLERLDGWLRTIATSSIEGGEPLTTAPDKLGPSGFDRQLNIPFGLGME